MTHSAVYQKWILLSRSRFWGPNVPFSFYSMHSEICMMGEAWCIQSYRLFGNRGHGFILRQSSKLCQKRFSETENHFQVVFEFTQKEPHGSQFMETPETVLWSAKPFALNAAFCCILKRRNRTEPNRFSRKPKRTVCICEPNRPSFQFQGTETNRRFPAIGTSLLGITALDARRSSSSHSGSRCV